MLEGQNETLILEAGIGIKDIKIALNFNFKGVVGCLVTHEHL
jgi:phosphoribosyl 1,2-cyclic phosphodiesterase